jgi:hypothetical protein
MIQVVIHMCMETTLGICQYSYLYLKLAKMLCLSYYLSLFFFNKIGKEGRTGSAWKRGKRERERRGKEQEIGERDGPNNVYLYE